VAVSVVGVPEGVAGPVAVPVGVPVGVVLLVVGGGVDDVTVGLGVLLGFLVWVAFGVGLGVVVCAGMTTTSGGGGGRTRR
jgi:hypothetical protein